MNSFEKLSIQELLDRKIFLLNVRYAIESSDKLYLANKKERFYKYMSMFSSSEDWDKNFDMIISLFDDEIKNRIQSMSLDELSEYHEQLYIKNNEIVDSLINNSFESDDFYYHFLEGQCYVKLDEEILAAISSNNKSRKF